MSTSSQAGKDAREGEFGIGSSSVRDMSTGPEWDEGQPSREKSRRKGGDCGVWERPGALHKNPGWEVKVVLIV